MKATQQLFFAYVFSYPDSALPFAQQSIILAKKLKSESALVLAYSQYSAYASLTGDYPTALKFALDGLALAEHTGDFMLIGGLNSLLADLYLGLYDYEKAIWYGVKAKSVFDVNYTLPSTPPSQMHDTLSPYTDILNKLAEVYISSGQLDSAIKYMKVVEFGETFRPVQWPTVFYTYGNISYKKQDYSEAIKFYQRAVLSGIYYDLKKDLMDVYNSLAKTYYTIHQWDSSIYYGNKVLEVSTSAAYPSGKLIALELLAKSFKAKNNIDSTAKYLEFALSMKDSLFGRIKLSQLQNLAFNDQLRRQEIQEEQQQKVYRSRLYGLSGGLILLVIFIYLLYRNNRQKQKAKQDIEKAYDQLKATQSQLIQSEKMASLGELTAGIAHEIQNPLNFVNNFSEVNNELINELEEAASKKPRDASNEADIIATIKENSEKINHHGKRAESIVRGMLQHSRKSTGIKEPTDINALADEYMRLSYHGLRAKDKSFNVEFRMDLDPTIPLINVIPQDIGRVFLNLFNNAFWACAERSLGAVNEQQKNLAGLSNITINDQRGLSNDNITNLVGSNNAYASPNLQGFTPIVSLSTKNLKDAIEIRIADNGPGIQPNIIDKIFQPFFTTKPSGQGTGLGLSLAYDIVKAHGGSIAVNSNYGETAMNSSEVHGTEFIIQLPV